MGYSYEDAIDLQVTAQEARREVRKHGADWDEFLAELGERDWYRGEEVLSWLGY